MNITANAKPIEQTNNNKTNASEPAKNSQDSKTNGTNIDDIKVVPYDCEIEDANNADNNQAKEPLDKAGEGSLFPEFTNYTNERASELLNSWSNHATENTIELVDSLLNNNEVYDAIQNALANQAMDISNGELDEQYITCNSEGVYSIDTNQDGHAEASVLLNSDNQVSAFVISDEYNTSQDEVIYFGSIEVFSDNGSISYEDSDCNILKINNSGNITDIQLHYDENGKVIDKRVVTKNE